LVGYADISRELEIGRVIFEGAVHPAHRRMGIGKELLVRAINHSRGIGAHQVHIPIPDGMHSAQKLVQKQGFVLMRHHWRLQLLVEGGLSPAQLPSGVSLQQFAPGDEAKLTCIQNMVFSDSWGFKPNNEDEIRYRVGTRLCCLEGIVFAATGERIIGYCWTRINAEYNRCYGQGRGEVYMMGVHSDWRGQGIGRGVLLAGIDYLRRQGMGEVVLNVDSENSSAYALYKRLGFEKTSELLWYGMWLI